MSLSELPARELARLDAVCLDYELRLRDSKQLPSPSGLETASAGDATTDIDALVQRHGGEHAGLLRAELEAIRAEVSSPGNSSSTTNKPSILKGQGTHISAEGDPDAVQDSPIAGQDGYSVATPPDALTEAIDIDGMASAAAKALPPLEAFTEGRLLAEDLPVADAQLTESGLPAIGAEIGPYLLTGVLGRGGMGIVYRATDTRLDRSVAIKMLSVRGKQSDSLIERFQREAKAVAGLTHPHIVELFDVGVFSGLPYAVMEHLRGQTLAAYLKSRRLKSSKALPTEQIRRWGLQLAEALTIAHENGVIHRDLKPDNVMVLDRQSQSQASQGPSTQGQSSQRQVRSISDQISEADVSSLKLFDFGLSRIGSTQWNSDGNLTQLAESSGLDGPSSLDEMGVAPKGQSMSELIAEEKKRKAAVTPHDSSTRVGMILGTPGYMAPEQARGDVITTATDVFALGCVLYEAMFGRPAFEGDTPTKRFAAVLEKQPLPDPLRRRDDVELTDLILSMLTKDPAGRPRGSEVVDTLQNEALRRSASSYSAESAGSRSTGYRSPNLNHDTNLSDGMVVSRRRLIQIGVGGTAAAILGFGLTRGSSKTSLTSIRSIGVLSFQKVGTETRETAATPRPAGNQAFGEGELLSGLLVNELSRLEGFVVPKFVPMTASLPSEFQEAARLLEVDAIVTGTFSVNQDAMPQQIMTVNLEIVSGETGKLIEGITVPTAAGGNLIEQSVLARNLAELIGRELTVGDEVTKVNNPEAFTCLIKGRVRSDPDSVDGLEMALKCFEHAVSVDGNYAQAHAGHGLTAITLAARSNDARVGELIAESQQSTARALALSANNTEALLARAMFDYQVLTDFDAAEEQLSQLAKSHPNHWQVQHQAGWLKMIRFDEAAGLQLLRRATGLHPASRYLKADLARADWFRGNPDRATQAGLAMLQTDKNESSSIHARGLLIDLYEQSENYTEAAEVDPELSWRPGDNLSDYFPARAVRLSALPYGPFGESINAAILQIRRKDLGTRETAERLLSRLIAAQLPMLPLVVCKHPAMASMTVLEQAIETFPVLKIS